MSFDESPKDPKSRLGLKNLGGAKSMFDGKPKPPTQKEFDKQIQDLGEKANGYKKRAADLFLQFIKVVGEKTLPQNKNLFHAETEKELLQNMVQLANEVNNDPNEPEGNGSMTWIILLFKTCFSQRDRINELEYNIHLLQKKLDTSVLTDFIAKEITRQLKTLDKPHTDG
jgi:hypothetical protein